MTKDEKELNSQHNDVAETKSNKSLDNSHAESQKKKLKYPRSIPFIIGNEFCERFNYYGMRTILVLYLQQELNYNDDDSTVIFHVFSMLVYFMCVPGAIIADSWLGKFLTILSLSCVYVLGSTLVSVTAIGPLNLPRAELTMTGLALIALGSGGIKPCVSAFGGDQFKLPEQAKQAAVFFSIFYFSVNSGSLISTTVTPLLREDVHCFESKSCFPLAFGVPAMLMCLSIVIFVIGRPMYKIKPAAGNMLMKVTKCIGAAIGGRWREKKKNPREHWLDYADTKYDRQLIDDIKVLLRVLVLYIPLPLFWALFDQQGSRWTFQATRMDGTLGSIVVKPDQMQLINPFLILTFIPLYEAIFYPLLAKVGIRRPLQKLFCGGILAGIAFIISGSVELELEKTYPVIPGGNEADLRIFNTFNCDFNVKTDIPNFDKFSINAFDIKESLAIDVSKSKSFTFEITSEKEGCPKDVKETINIPGGKGLSLHFKNIENQLKIYQVDQKIDKPSKSDPLIQFYANVEKAKIIKLIDTERDNKVAFEINKDNYRENGTYPAEGVTSSIYEVHVNNKVVEKNLHFKQGGVYTILISEKDSDSYRVKELTIVKPNSMSMFWLVPQYFIMTLGEVMFSVTGLEFSYSQAPKSMKSVLQACWLLTVAIGNVIVVIIAEAKIFNSQAHEFFLFAGLMLVDMVLFAIMAYFYKPNVIKSDSQDDDEPVDENIVAEILPPIDHHHKDNKGGYDEHKPSNHHDDNEKKMSNEHKENSDDKENEHHKDKDKKKQEEKSDLPHEIETMVASEY